MFLQNFVFFSPLSHRVAPLFYLSAKVCLSIVLARSKQCSYSVVWHSNKVTKVKWLPVWKPELAWMCLTRLFYLCKSAPIHADLTASLNSLGDEVSFLPQLKQTCRQTIGWSLLLHLAEAAEKTWSGVAMQLLDNSLLSRMAAADLEVRLGPVHSDARTPPHTESAQREQRTAVN